MSTDYQTDTRTIFENDREWQYSTESIHEELNSVDKALNLDRENYSFTDTFVYSSNGDLSTATPVPSKSKEFLSEHSKNFEVLQKWQGQVLEVDNKYFWSRLTPLKGAQELIDAEISIEEIDEDDRELIQPGAVFYWNIGYLKSPGRMAVSFFRFRRLPLWTEEDLIAAKEEAEKLGELFSV